MWMIFLISIVGFVQGYLLVPAILLAPQMADWIMTPLGRSNDSVPAHVIATLMAGLGILVLLIGITAGWAVGLAQFAPPVPRVEFGRYWGMTFFLGMIAYVLIPVIVRALTRTNESRGKSRGRSRD
jgi:hypothetical protein